ncbi:uncharacterized protein At4g15970-like [Asparagus officinalis]|uniref:uncharacterized protein At4g15970-like n=1 Tax=Asparagus officinalis TaxID=4686 RepID=UPI00098E7C51|nr:uncharacterized protein At4g15970-like [Asparagus officinalis]
MDEHLDADNPPVDQNVGGGPTENNDAGGSPTNADNTRGGPNADKLELTKVLKKATMDDRTVIITVLNEAWALPGSIFDLFLESFHIGEQTEKLLNHLVVVARDPKAFRRCKLIHKYCFLVQTQATDFSGEKSHDYLKFRSLELLTSVLDLGYNFIYTDTDIMWLRNPISHFSNEAQITIASDYFCGNSSDQRNQAICGFLYVKSNGQTIEFFKYWIMSRTVYPNKNEQQIFNIIKQDGYATRLALEVRFLDTTHFGGLCYPNKDLSKVCTVHANCCVGVKRKIHDLKIFLEDWKNYTSRPEAERKRSGISWRVPDKCKLS